MTETIEMVAVLLLFVLICVAIGFFLNRIRYVHKTGISLWGVYLIVELTFMLLIVFAEKLIPTLPPEKSRGLFENMLMPVEIAIVLLIYKQQRPQINGSILWVLFGLAMALWLGEFYMVYPAGTNGLYHLQVTPVFICLIEVTLVWVYLVDFYKQPFVHFSTIPFFWINMGWLVGGTLTSTTYFIEIASALPTVKQSMLAVNALAACVSVGCYCIAFWKSKQWVIHQKLTI